MARTRTLDRRILIVMILAVIFNDPLTTFATTTTAWRMARFRSPAVQTEVSTAGEPRASIPVDLPAGEVAWHVGAKQSGTETDTATAFELGFVYALNDPLLLLFDDGTPLERMQADGAYPVDAPIEAYPVAMMAEAPVPYVTIGVGTPEASESQNALPFRLEGGEYDLSLWLVDTSELVPEEVSQRLASQTNPILVLVRSGEITIQSAADGADPEHLASGDWTVITPDRQIQAAQGAEPPVLLFGTLDQPDLAGAQPSGSTTESGASAPQGSGGQGSSGAQPRPIVVTSTETPIVDSTDAPMVEPTVQPCHIDNQGECGPAPMPETTIPSDSGTSGESGSFEPGLEVENNPPIVATEASGTGGSFEPGLEIENNPPILLPTQASGHTGVFDTAPMVDLPIFSAGSTANAPIDPIAVEQLETSCFALLADADADGLPDACEEEYGTDPHKADSDGDGLSDGDEVGRHDSNPMVFDTDGDGLTDYDEVMAHGSSPTQTDSDGDGLNDGNEVNEYNTDAANSDSDGDGLADGTDLGGGTDPLNADFDGDGLYDGEEVNTYGTYPKAFDSDEDGLSDGDEVYVYGTLPLDPYTDEDCLTDGDEIALGTSAFAFVTDGDGYDDESEHGRANPLDSNDTPGEFLGEKLVDYC